MAYYPVCLELNGRSAVVVGGGNVAERKVRGLLNCGANLQVISPEITPGLTELNNRQELHWRNRTYENGDLQGAFLVIAATDDTDVQRRVFEEAEERGILVNVADVPLKCNFILPATVRQGDLTVAVSTAGKSPALAKQLRMDLEKRFGPEYKILVDVLGNLRRQILAKGYTQKKNEDLFNQLLHKEMAVWIREENWTRIEDHVQSLLGAEFGTEWLSRLTNS